MTILQPRSAVQAFVNQGEGFYRILQKAVGNGDIFELDQSVKAIIVGPQSDFAEYTVYYYDPLKDLAVSVANLSADQPFIGDIKARLDQRYPGTGAGDMVALSGKIIVVPKDLYLPEQMDVSLVLGRIVTYAPTIDLMMFQQAPSTIPDKRPSRVIRSGIDLVNAATVGQSNALRLPVYGRRRWDFQLLIFDTDIFGGTYNVEVLPRAYNFNFRAIPGRPALTLAAAANISVDKTLGGGQGGMSYDSDAANTLANLGTRGYFDFVEFMINPAVDLPVNGDGTNPNGYAQFCFRAFD